MIKENRKYVFNDFMMINKKLISFCIHWGLVAALFGYIYTMIQSPAEFRKGIYPEIGNLRMEIIEVSKRLDALENKLKPSCYILPSRTKPKKK